MPDQPGQLRAFVALTPPHEWTAALAQFQTVLGSLPGARQIRWTKPAQIHLTLRFLGNIRADEAQLAIDRLKFACRGFKPFTLDLAGLGFFPNPRRPRIIWLGLAGATASLLELQRSGANAFAALGDHREEEGFHPHLTIGRVRPDARPPFLELTRMPSPPQVHPWHVGVVDLMRSELGPAGARHSLLHRQPLLLGPDKE